MEARNSRERLLGPALRTQPDRRLVALARDGGTPAQEEIVRRYRAALVRYAGSIVGAAAAEDVVQEALAKGVGSLEEAGEDLRLRPWLYAIVRNTALNHLRDAGPATEQLDENYDGVEQPPQALERREGVRSLLRGLRGLPPQQRQAIVKRELEGRSHEEIAAELGVSSGAARQLIFRAREALRVGFGSLLPMPLLRWLAEGGGGDAAVGAAAGAGGGALAAKAAVAVFAAGAAVTAGVAIDHGAKHRPAGPPAAEAAVRPAVALPGGGGDAAPAGGPAAEPVLAVAEDGEDARRSGRSDEDRDDRGDRDDSSGPGSGKERDDDGEDRDEHTGRGQRGDDDRSGKDEDRSGHRGSGDDDDRSGSSGSRHASGSDDDRSGSSGSRSGRDDSDDDEVEADGGGSGKSGSGGGDDDYADDDSSGSGSSGGGDDSDEVEVEEVDFTTPSPTTAATAPVEETAIESDDDSSGSGGGEEEIDD